MKIRIDEFVQERVYFMTACTKLYEILRGLLNLVGVDAWLHHAS